MTSAMRLLAIPLLLVTAACATSAGSAPADSRGRFPMMQQPPSPSAAPSAPFPAADAAPEVTPPSAAAEGSGAGGAPAAGDPEPVQEILRETHYPKGAAVVITDWLTARRATARMVEKECWDLADRVGVPAAPGLLCVRSTSRPSRVQARIYRLEDRRLRAVWEGPIGTWTNWLELTPLLSADGATLTVHERRPFSCEAALDEYTAKEGAGIPMDWGGVLREGCALRGAHTYDGKRYVKEPAASGAPGGALRRQGE